MKKIFITLLLSLFPAITKAQNISMTFHNGSFRSIPLIIPGVMNPNLSPKSNSDVSLEVGQKIYFLPNGKRNSKALLFIVDTTFKKDTVLQIDEIIERRKLELQKE
jgi:hypothetical protein